MAKRRRNLYLRLAEKEVDNAPEPERLKRVQTAMEKFGELEWVCLPTTNSRGGYNVSLILPEPVDFDALVSLIEREGYAVVI